MRVPWDVLLEAERDNEGTSEMVGAHHGTNLSVLYQIMASKGLKKGTLGKQSNARNTLNRRVVYGTHCHKQGTREKGASYMLYTPFKFVSVGVLLELK